MEREDLVDELLELHHDLGKYIHLPLSFLPADASPADVAAAVEAGLQRTRRGPGGVESADAIWTAFEIAFAGRLESYPSFGRLRDVVRRALAWADVRGELDRAAVSADLTAVAPAVRGVIDEVSRDR